MDGMNDVDLPGNTDPAGLPAPAEGAGAPADGGPGPNVGAFDAQARLTPVADKTYAHTSPGGAAYVTSLRLSPGQKTVLDAIIDGGVAKGYDPSAIAVVADQAFYESSLGRLRTNPTNSSVSGLFQYDNPTWTYLGHSDISIGKDADQISAMYQDLDKYNQDYAAGQKSGYVPKYLPFSDYVEVQHHLGDNSGAWGSPVVSDYNKKSTALGLQFGPAAGSPQPRAKGTTT